MSILDEVNEELIPVLPEFISNLRDDIEELQTALEQMDYEDMERIAHGIKGSTDSMGLTKVKEQAYTVEQQAGEGSEEIAEEIDGLVSLVNQVEEELD